MTTYRKIDETYIEKISNVLLQKGFSTINELAREIDISFTTLKKFLFEKLEIQIKTYTNWRYIGLIPILLVLEFPRQLLDGDYVMRTFKSNYPVGTYFQYLLIPPDILFDLKKVIHLIDAKNIRIYDFSLKEYNINIKEMNNMKLKTFENSYIEDWKVIPITRKHLKILNAIKDNYLLQNKQIAKVVNMNQITISKYRRELLDNEIIKPIIVKKSNLMNWHLGIVSANIDKHIEIDEVDNAVYHLNNLQIKDKKLLTISRMECITPKDIKDIQYNLSKSYELYLLMDWNLIGLPNIHLYDDRKKKWIWNYESIGIIDII